MSVAAVAGASFAVIVPAHNEENLIGSCLEFAGQLDTGEAEIVVVANGCTDRTARRARAVPGVRVVESEAAGKAAALNLGDRTATAWPRIYLDADVRVTAGALRRLRDVLAADGAAVSAPRVSFRTDGRPWPVRAFYAVYRRLPYVTDGLVGLGVYGLSRAGRLRFGDFPQVTADDLFVQRLFEPHERAVLDDETFVVETPWTLRDLVAVRTRTAYGNAELAGAPEAGDAFARTTSSTGRALVRLAAREPWLLPAVAVYAGVTLLARVRARGADGGAWHRDLSTRQA